MLTIKRKSILSILLAAGCFMPVSVMAQSEEATEALEDITLELDEMPPQPVQTTIPEVESVTAEVEKPAGEPMKAELNVGDIEYPDYDDIPAEPTGGLTPVPEEVAATSEPAQPVPHSGQYYDSDSIVPSSDLGGIGGPREVDPRYEPGSSFVVVRKSAGPESPQARMVAAQRALKLGRYSSALELYEQLYKKNPKNRQILMGLAVAQQHSGFRESAIATYEELLTIDPNNTDATVNMLGLLKGQYPSVTYRKLRELWENNSQNPGIAAQLGLTSASVGNIEDAIRYLGIAASLEPNNPSHYYNMAVVTDQAGAYKDAVDLYEKALELDATYGSSRAIPRSQIYDRLSHLRRL